MIKIFCFLLLGKDQPFNLKIPEGDDGSRACLHFVFKLINTVNTQVTIVEFIIIVPRCNQPVFR